MNSPLYRTQINTDHGAKEIAVYAANALSLEEPIDILTASAFRRSYLPIPRTLFCALDEAGVNVSELAKDPLIDLRRVGDVWLSTGLHNPRLSIGRIGCVEFALAGDREQIILNAMKCYFRMLDIAAVHGVPMETVAMPLLGSGDQGIAGVLSIVPIINECVAFLKRNTAVRRIWFVDINPVKAQLIADALQNSYTLMAQQLQTKEKRTLQEDQLAFISYSSKDKNIADNLCAKLEAQGIRVWYAPRDVKGPYAAAITEAIERATHFVVILSKHSIASQHVLNEIDLAFQKLPERIKFKPLRIDETLFTPSFKYYLSRQHWMDAIVPPLEARLDEFVTKLLADI